MSRVLRVQARAKLNLSLEVVGERKDGFHNLVSVMQEVELADTLSVRAGKGIDFRCSEPELEGPDNLVVRAAQLIHSRYGVGTGCAGLGGGSSDAAATLVALNRFWNTEADCAAIHAMAEELGSDVPFFLHGGTALIEGRGERVTQIRNVRPAWYMLLNPRCVASTAAVFAELDRSEWTDGQTSYAVARTLAQSDRPAPGVNALQAPLFRLMPLARSCFEEVSGLAPGRTFISGSGPTVAAVFETSGDARELAARLAGTGHWVVVCRSRATSRDGTRCD
jgi:4-diphosphocytidyl-2-C-methyl-D-erythritol kinase